MKMLFIIATLGPGGAERAITTLAGAYAQAGDEVTLLACADGPEASLFPVHPSVRLVRQMANGGEARRRRRLGQLWQTGRNMLVNVRRIRAVLRETRPAVVISFVETANICALMAAVGLGVPVIVAERTDPHEYRVSGAIAGLRRLTYPWAAALVVQTGRARTFFSRRVQRRAQVIPNPVVAPAAAVAPEKIHGGRPRLVAVGRLGAEKGFDLLLAAFVATRREHAAWSLVIFGEGRERTALTAQIQALGLDGWVHLPGLTTDIFAQFAAADLFVLSSRFEGFPNVLLEAMAMGLPCVAFDCPSGPREIIRDGVDGVLVAAGAVDALAGALGRLMGDAAERRRLGAEAVAVRERFSLESVRRRWDEVIRAAVSGQRAARARD